LSWSKAAVKGVWKEAISSAAAPSGAMTGPNMLVVLQRRGRQKRVTSIAFFIDLEEWIVARIPWGYPIPPIAGLTIESSKETIAVFD